ncbi:MAG TPA: hypothetical protein VFJ84_01960 [Candidatus Saccharimonadales bacterium]|nr:hypothetical protein [Candidatus Saccharimonadales bacterium]
MIPTQKAPADKPLSKNEAVPRKKGLEMNSKNLRWLLIASLALSVIVFLGAVMLGLSALTHESQNMAGLKAKSQATNEELLNLEQSKKDVEKYSYFKEVAQTVIPKDKDQAKAVLDIFQFAQDANIRIQSITFPASSLGGRTSAAKAQDATSSSASSAAITQAKPVSGIPGLYSLPLTITPQTSSTLPPNLVVTYPKILKFLKSIENNRRTAQITSLVIQPPTEVGKSLSFTLTINIFIKP